MANKLVSLEVINIKQEMRRIENEVVDLVNKDMLTKMTYATNQLRVVTPVDKGEARAGWRQKTRLSMRGKFLSGTIINDVEHISILNRGHSQQAPRYFVEQVLSTIGLITPI